LIKKTISGDVQAIGENIQVIRSKFQPLLDAERYDEEVQQLIDVIPQMLENVVDMTRQLEQAFQILTERVREK
jgi:TolB-like protein